MSLASTKVSVFDAQGVAVGEFHLTEGAHLIGRGVHCAIQIDGDGVSRQHARLTLSSESIEIEDLDSTSGTTLDGVPIQGRAVVQAHQRLWVSNYHVLIERLGFRGLVEGSRMGAGRYVLRLELGKGGMGAVWLAYDTEQQVDVALKVFTDERAGTDAEGLNDLRREVEKTQCLQHPHIVRMGEFWKSEGEPPFISMEYVEGTDLHELKRSTSESILPWSRVRDYMLQLCDALNYAHSQRLAHRDIKPSNFLIDHEGKLKLTDFGISASLANSALSVTAPSLMGSGTPQYMSPQQMDGNPPSVTDDIYSVGATFYDLLTSKPPFFQGELSYQIRHSDPVPISRRLQELGLQNDIPDYIEAIVMACLQKDPGQRPQSMEIIRLWIESAESGGEADPGAPHATQAGAALSGWEAEPESDQEIWPPRNETAQTEIEQPKSGWMGVGIAAGLALLIWLGTGLAGIKPIFAGMSPLVAGFGGEESVEPDRPAKPVVPPVGPTPDELEELWLTNATRLVESRGVWVGLLQEMQRVCARLEPEVFVLVDPDEMVPFTNDLSGMLKQYPTPPQSVTNVQSALWVRSMQSVPAETGVLDTVRLQLRARNIQPRLRPSVNREYARLVLKQFHESPLIVADEESSKLVGTVPTPDLKEPWFDFEMELKLAYPLLATSAQLELGDFQKPMGQFLAAPYPGQQDGIGFFNRLYPAIVELNRQTTNQQVRIPEDYPKIGGNGFSFSFASVLESASVPTNRLSHLQAQLDDVVHMMRVLRGSGIQSIESLQRSKVCPDDFLYVTNGLKPELIFHDQDFATNSVGIAYPYRVKFHGLSASVADAVSRFAEHSACRVRNVHITPNTQPPIRPRNASVFFPAGLPQEYAQTLANPQLALTTSNVRTLVREESLEVTLDLDYTRRTNNVVDEPVPEPLQALLQITPPQWALADANHLVFNPRVWKEIHLSNVPEPRWQADSIQEPLGISALKITAIRTNYATISGRTVLSGGTIRHELAADDSAHLVKPYITQIQAPLATFLPQVPMPSQQSLTRRVGAVPNPQAVLTMHQFTGVNARWLAYQPDWEIKAIFQAASRPGQAQLAQARQNPSGRINGMTYDLDLITRNAGEDAYNTNRVRFQSDAPHQLVRSFEADLIYQTPYQNAVVLKQFREGRRMLIDGEVFQVTQITGTSVTLVSDLACGGNGKIYRKTFSPSASESPGQPRPD